LPEESILPTTFGWDPTRFVNAVALDRSPTPRFIFMGWLGVRKGVPDLLEAWRLANVDGELVLAGTPESPEIARLVREHCRSGRVRAVGYIDDVGPLLKSSDVFVFPTLEEGGPQVTYEAAGCGLPVITTTMGAARIIEDGLNGIVVEPGSVPHLAEAIRVLATRPDLRARYGAAGQRDAERFTYQRVGAQRSQLISEAVQRLRSNPTRSGAGSADPDAPSVSTRD
jgi:glycosyltransferase involved in cell wall biosynthesis